MNVSEKIIKIEMKEGITPPEKISQGDWIDLRSAETVELSKGQFYLLSLGIKMKLPSGYEAHVAPRGSTFKYFKVIQTNSVGVIDESYCGKNDWWFMPILAVEDTSISKNDKICQFRIMEKQPSFNFVVGELDGESRGGHGSTGKR